MGGAIYGYSTSFAAYGCEFDSNQSVFSGGAITAFDVGTPYLENCLFTNNFCENDGGDFAMYSNAFVVFASCEFRDSESLDRGGALFVFNSSTSVENCRIENSVSGSFGGGIYSDESTVSLVSTDIRSNTADISGGGIFAQAGTPILSDAVICGNAPNQVFGVTKQPGNCLAENCEDCEDAPDPCPTDLNGDGVTDGADLGLYFVYSGECDTEDCPGDFNGDQFVGGADLGILLSEWGSCP